MRLNAKCHAFYETRTDKYFNIDFVITHFSDGFAKKKKKYRGKNVLRGKNIVMAHLIFGIRIVYLCASTLIKKKNQSYTTKNFVLLLIKRYLKWLQSGFFHARKIGKLPICCHIFLFFRAFSLDFVSFLNSGGALGGIIRLHES